MGCFKPAKTCSFIILLVGHFSLYAQQSLKDSLFGGKIKADTTKTYVSKDTSKYVAPKVYNPVAAQGDTKKTQVAKLDESMPDSLNKNFYFKQKAWKRFIDVNTSIVTQEAADTKKVKKGEYAIDIEYQIGINGKVTTKTITCNPPNDYLTEQVTEFMKRPPMLAAPIYSDGKPRALDATQPISIIKK